MSETAVWARRRLGRRLRERREQSGLSLREVGDRVGLSHGHVAKLERGELRRPPSHGMLARLSAALDLELDALLEVGSLRVVARTPVVTGDVDQFATLMLAPGYKPHDMRRAFLAHFPPLHRRLIVELAVNAFQRGEHFGKTGDGDPIEVLLNMFRADIEPERELLPVPSSED